MLFDHMLILEDDVHFDHRLRTFMEQPHHPLFHSCSWDFILMGPE